MRLAHFCIDRPVFATVLSILVVLVGLAGYFTLPLAQYPEIAPPTVVVNAQYPGASAEVVSNTVATPIEQEINGVENMLYMSSQATGDGQLSITVTFALGTDVDEAQVLVQNRVAVAEPRLPEDVRRLGVTVRKSSPDILMVVQLFSPDNTRDQLYLANYATLQLRDALLRVPGVGDVRMPASRDYAMVVWLDPDRVAARNLTAGEVVAALRAQNVQVAAGVINQPPVPAGGAFQLNVETLGRLSDPAQFEDIIVRTDADGRVTRVRDIARVELTAQSYRAGANFDGRPSQPIQVFQQPGSNALETAERVEQEMRRLGERLPAGLAYDIPFNPTLFIAESVNEVYKTLAEAIILVVAVVILFLQSWRAAIIPILAIPISLIGTFAVMAALGYSLNNLSLLGLVLAIGIVVDDAIVVVENIERHLRAGLSPRDAAHRSMDEISGALVAIALVLSAVFIPAALIPGISGQFFRQFAVTIAASTIISAFVSLTLSPALGALLLKPHQPHAPRRGPLGWLARGFAAFNAVFDRLARGYAGMTRRVLRLGAFILLPYAGLLALTGWQLERAPRGFIPEMDQGYFITSVQLPPGSALPRTENVMNQLSNRLMEMDGVAHVVAIAGIDGATFTSNSAGGVAFVILDPFAERAARNLGVDAVMAAMPRQTADLSEARLIPIKPPSVRGMGNAGGFKMMVQDRTGGTPAELEAALRAVVAEAARHPELVRVFTPFNTATPKLYADIDRVKAEMLGVPASRVFEALEIYLGSAYVNDFNFLGRTFQVRAQADGGFRQDPAIIAGFRTRSESGAMVPLSAVASFEERTGPYRVPRYNLAMAGEVQGASAPGASTGAALDRMEAIAAQVLPEGYGFEWTELALQERLAGNSGLIVFAASIVFVFLLLAAQYESWMLPLSVMLIVPMCLLAAVSGLLVAAMNVNILAQIGFVVLIGLAAKNAILVVEFARQREEEGLSPAEAAVDAARVRLRPILMTSLAFILGVVPLVLAQGAGAELRQALGVTVFAGMLGVTLFGLVFTPAFYVICRALPRRSRAPKLTREHA
ncbi:efflux RND transporter permease subunit [Ancylobacter defluvii]|uniref:Efflux pump membrane transporter n=1 Tax=Ancylobacter defluvii TaxID=1282440 RepID=A0A9W6N9H6_9HYPH|nr:multidrug efflux RND transporter permease subunit [Ancylobacter defluvii]MBS7587626.1 multidrug efflux RND transporter permease subunit [Ancylobacter defluvii]GLK82436.1 multidrug efflux RND transporter permease subunit [Ancylobacter defluvii]